MILWPPSNLIMGGRQHRRCAAPPRCERQTPAHVSTACPSRYPRRGRALGNETGAWAAKTAALLGPSER